MRDLCLSAEEYESLYVHNNVQAGAWDQMASAVDRGEIKVAKSADHYRNFASLARDRARMFKELSAAEEENQTRWERTGEVVFRRDDVTLVDVEATLRGALEAAIADGDAITRMAIEYVLSLLDEVYSDEPAEKHA